MAKNNVKQTQRKKLFELEILAIATVVTLILSIYFSFSSSYIFNVLSAYLAGLLPLFECLFIVEIIEYVKACC